jgi:hypothetical protein
VSGRVWTVVIVIAAIVAAAVFLINRHSANETLVADQAISKGYVTVYVRVGDVSGAASSADEAASAAAESASAPAAGGGSNDQSGSSPATGPTVVTITFTRTDSAPSGVTTIVIPAGTLIANGAASGQWLMTTQEVRVSLSAQTPTAGGVVQVYCLEQFKTLPGAQTSLLLAVSAPELGVPSDIEEMDDVRRLDQCLASTAASYRMRQAAIWLIDQNLDKGPYDSAKSTISGGYRTGLMADNTGDDHDQLIRGIIASQNPSYDEQQTAQAAQAMTPDVIQSAIDKEADTLADKVLSDMLGVKPFLDSCGFTTGSMSFFLTAPDAASSSQ